MLKELPILFSGEVGKPFDNDFYMALGGDWYHSRHFTQAGLDHGQ